MFIDPVQDFLPRLTQQTACGILFSEHEPAELVMFRLPEFYHVSSFMLCATLKNQKWVAAHQQTEQVALMIPLMMKQKYWHSVPRSRDELLEHLNLSDRKNLRTKYLNPLLASGKPKMTLPDKPRSKQQKYVKA